jgi:hypothetical protein
MSKSLFSPLHLSRQLTVFVCIAISSPSLLAVPDFPPPKGATVEVVGNNMVLNGIGSDIRAFYSKKSLEKVSKFYRQQWQDSVGRNDDGEELPGYTETDVMVPWRLFTRIEDGYLMTVQFQEADNKGVWGYLAVSRLSKKARKQNPVLPIVRDIPVLGDSRIISELVNKDPGKHARTMIIYNNHSLGSNISFYRSHYLNRGFSVDNDTNLSQGAMHSLVFKSTRKRINIMLIGSASDTRVVINAVTNTIF